MDIQQLAILRTRDIEQAFAACAMIWPLQTVTECGWLAADDLVDVEVAAFWRSLLSEVRQGMTEDEATGAAIRCSTAAGLPVKMASWMRDAAYSTGARAMADEIARRQYKFNFKLPEASFLSSMATQDERKLNAPSATTWLKTAILPRDPKKSLLETFCFLINDSIF